MNEVFSIVLAGEAGQGIKTAELLMLELLKETHTYFFISREYMSRVRGGINSTQIILSENPVNSIRRQTDLFIALTDGARERYSSRISEKTKTIDGDSFIEIAEESGDKRFANTAVFGYICAYIGAVKKTGIGIIKKKYAEKPDTLEGNIEAFEKGYERFDSKGLDIKAHNKKIAAFDSSKAVAYGALFGGCDFISAYPMSPSTGALNGMAELSKEHGIIVEQAEDEIAAVNMAIGAWYAGARALVTTSGGGFALMSEGISLAGGTETPLVIHLAQRPGPATGLPTRTEQGDLQLALYSGHGDFPRALFAPGDQTEAMECMIHAFDTADRYQIPVFILTDQHMLDAVKPVFIKDIPKPDMERHTVKTEDGYKRYAFTDDGISPRGIPGYGTGKVCVDSDEHDQAGHITEDFEIRKKMVEKRNKRLRELEKEALSPRLIGDAEYETLIVCYGSNLGIALDLEGYCREHKMAFLHFPQLYPLKEATGKYFEKAKKVMCLENNYTGQFADIIIKRYGIEISGRILKYSGEPFYLEEVIERIGGAE